jgi:hypothetical protein
VPTSPLTGRAPGRTRPSRRRYAVPASGC